MRFQIRVKTEARQSGVQMSSDGVVTVRVKEPPVDGKANKAVIKILAKHFKVSPFAVRIVSGEAAKIKTIEIQSE